MLARLSLIGCLAFAYAVLALVQIPCKESYAQVSAEKHSFVVQPEVGQPAHEVEKGYFVLTVRPGELRTVRLVVQNTGGEQLSVISYPVDGIQTGGGIAYSTRREPLVGMGRWISVTPEQLRLEPGEAGRVVATIRVPEDSLPADYVAGIAVEDELVDTAEAGSHAMIDVHYRRVTGILATVPGNRTAALEVDRVTLSSSGDGNQATIGLKNTGNTLLKVKGVVSVLGSQGLGKEFSLDPAAIMPGSRADVAVRLVGLDLEPGLYAVSVKVMSPEHGELASWRGDVTLSLPEEAGATSRVQHFVLEPIRSAEELVLGIPIVVPLVGLVLVVVGVALGLMISRRINGQ